MKIIWMMIDTNDNGIISWHELRKFFDLFKSMDQKGIEDHEQALIKEQERKFEEEYIRKQTQKRLLEEQMAKSVEDADNKEEGADGDKA